MNSFDIVDIAISAGTEKFSEEYTVNKDRVAEIKKACGYLDEVLEDQIDIDSVQAEVNDKTKDLIICIEGSCLELMGNPVSPFFKMVEITDAFGFRPISDSAINLNLLFEGVWNRTI